MAQSIFPMAVCNRYTRRQLGADLIAIGALCALLAGCAVSRPMPIAPVSHGLQLPAGYSSSVIAAGLRQPTAMTLGPVPDPLTGGPRRLYVAQLNGGEDDATGQIVAIDESTGAQDVVLTQLRKPTGLAWFNDMLVVVSFRDVLAYSIRDRKLQSSKTFVSGVRFNGRSLGHIRVGPSVDPFTRETEPRLYFHSSGGDSAVSGYLYSMQLDGSDQRIVARGLKNAYATGWDPAGTLYVTEIGDNIASVPVEEVNIIQQDGDYGWPNCAAGAACSGTLAPLATFPPHATPTGIVWWEGDLIVTLWGPTDPHVARINLSTGTVSDFARGLQHPIDAIVSKQGTLLLLDYAGSIVEVRRPATTPNIAPPQPSPTPN